MYESFFGFQERPFNETGRLDYYFPGESIEQARRALVRIIDHASGPGLVVGPAGTGKTLLCRMLAEHFRYSYDVVHLACNRLCTRRALLQNILFELKLAYRQREEGELRLSLIDHLGRSEGQRQGMLLLVDEAHTLPLRLLDEVRMITNLVRDGQPRVRLVVVGGPALEEKFAHPKLDSFNQRIAARCYLGSLTRDETIHYLRHRVHVAGGRPDPLFADDAYRAIYQATDGIPRLVNQIVDQALSLTALRDCRQISSAAVEEAWADLQQLPTPWRTPAMAAAEPAGVVEFGILEDDAQDVEDFDTNSTSPALRMTDLPEKDMLPAAETSSDTTAEPTVLWCSNDAPTTSGLTGPISFQSTTRSTRVTSFGEPFDGDFDDEEVIVCRYSSLEAASSRGRLKIVTPMEDDLGVALSEIPHVAALSAEPTESLAVDTVEVENVEIETVEVETAEIETVEVETVTVTAEEQAEPPLLNQDVGPNNDDSSEIPPFPAAAVGYPELDAEGSPHDGPSHAAAARCQPEWVEEVDLAVYQACQFATAIYDSALEPGGLDWARWPSELAELTGETSPETDDAEPIPAIVSARIVETQPTVAEAEPASVVLRAFPNDDRDIIIVEEEDEAHFGVPTLAITDRPQQQEYRQLFAKLRQG